MGQKQVLIKCLSSITVNLRHQAAFLKKLANEARRACLENYHTLPRLFLSRFAVERNNRKTLTTLQNQSVLRVEVVECNLPSVIKGVCNHERGGIGWQALKGFGWGNPVCVCTEVK